MKPKVILFIVVAVIAILLISGVKIPNSIRSVLTGGPNTSYSIVIDTINSQPPTQICFVGQITLTGHFTMTSPVGQPSQYNVEIDWGDGIIENSLDSPSVIVLTQTLDDPINDMYAFDFTATHTANSYTSSVSLHLFHTQPPGAGGSSDNSYSSSVCIAPPTMAVLNIKKEVSNTNGGTAVDTDFTLYLKDSTFSNVISIGNGVSSPFNADSAEGVDFLISPEANPYTISEDLLANYQQTGITGDCASNGSISLTANNNYSCTIMNSDISAPSTHTITSSVGSNGTISPLGATSVTDGTDQAYTITASGGYHISDVVIDSVSVGAISTFTFTNVIADHTISATFAIDSVAPGNHTITSSAGSNGSISPLGAVSVTDSTDQSFTITANNGYHISDVLVDSVSVGAVSAYSFTNVTTDHTISATYEVDSTNTGGNVESNNSGRKVTGFLPKTDCTKSLYLDKFMRLGYQNDEASVIKLQTFLNNYLNTNIPVIGIFGPRTETAVRMFQLINKERVLKPWNEENPTGIVYITTETEINNISCPELKLPIPTILIPWDKNPLTPKPITDKFV